MNANQDHDEFSVDQIQKKWWDITANGGVLLEQEFNTLRKLDERRIRVATNPINKSKNRYPLVYPYDEDFCRVKLNIDNNEKYRSASDYINASIVRSVLPEQVTETPKRFFYAAQGPTVNTLDDFLRMIVEQEIELIIMLSCPYDPVTRTYIQEHAPYFSEKAKSSLETTFFKVNTTVVCSSYRYTGRRLHIQSKLGEASHSCEHYHYAEFIDKRVPNDCHSMIGLIMRLSESKNPARRTLVHCSAGVGRTGVLLALYYLIESFGDEAVLNVKQVVNNMRFYRAHLVQNEEQYEYIYRCLAEMALHPCDGRSLDKFLQDVRITLPKADSHDSIIFQDFEHRNARIQLPASITKKMAEQYSASNRDQTCVPYDYNRVILHSPSESIYINASKVANIIQTNGIILTQEPIKATLQPFFSMLLQEHKTFIVAVEQLENPNYVELEYTGPKEITVHRGNVKYSRNKFGDYYRSYKMNVQQSKLRELNVFVYEYTGAWTEDGSDSPVDLERFIRFVDRSIYHQKKMDPNRLGLLVHDRNGGAKAAFYCIVQNLIDRLLIDDRISIENFISIICQQRINAIPTLKQYVALYESVRVWSVLRQRGALECAYAINKDQI